MEPVTKRRANVFISVMLCIVLFLFSCIFAILLILRVGNAAVIVKHTDLYWIIHETEISHYLLFQLNGLHFHDTEIDLMDVDEFIKIDAVSREIGGVVDGYARAFLAGDLDYYLTTDEIYIISTNLEPELNSLFNYHMTDTDHKHFAQTLDDIMNFRALTVGGIIEDVGIENAITYFRIYTYLVWVVGLFWAVIIFLIFYRQKKKIADAFLLVGIPVALTGLIFLAVWLLFDIFPWIFNNFTLYFLARSAGGLLYLFMWHGFAFVAVGVLSIAAYFVLPRLSMKNKPSSP